jgi:hypothetical protein
VKNANGLEGADAIRSRAPGAGLNAGDAAMPACNGSLLADNDLLWANNGALQACKGLLWMSKRRLRAYRGHL